MDLKTLLLTFNGRINRAKYWLGVLALVIYWIAAGLVIGVLVTLLGGSLTLTYVLAALAFILSAWMGLAIGFKRIHDRNKSAWWLLLFYGVPGLLQGVAAGLGGQSGTAMLLNLAGAAVAIWGFVEIGCLRGTAGPNTYGPDPLPPES